MDWALANFKSNENPVFYWVHDVWCGGVLAEEFRWVRDGWYGFGYGYGCGYGTGTVRVRYMGMVGTVHGYGFRTHVPYPCTVPTVPVPCTQIAAEIRTMYPNSGRNSGRSAAISAAIWVHGTGTVGTVHGYGSYPCIPYPCTVPTVPMYRTRTVPVPYLYGTRTRTRTQTPYQPSRTYHLAYRPASNMANRALLFKLAKLSRNSWI